MPVSTIGVGGLSTTSHYADAFVVQVSDTSGFATILQTIVSGVVWDGTAWNQTDAIFFDGLTLGSTYYLRCAVRAPVSGVLSPWTDWSTVAGATPVPACTFSGSYTGTLSGVSYLIAAASVPVDISCFQAWWSVDGSSPISTTPPLLGYIPPGLSFAVFAPGVPGQSISLFVRGVNTSQQAQTWVGVGGAVPVMATVGADGQLSSIAIISGKSTILGDISDLATGTIGLNSIANPHFSQPANSGSGDSTFLGWTSDVQTYIKVSSDTVDAFSGSPTLKISTVPLVVLPNGTIDHNYFSSASLPVSPRSKFYVEAQVKTSEDFILPVGVTAFTELGTRIFYKDGTSSTLFLPQLTADTGWSSVHGEVTIPALSGSSSLPASVQFCFHTRLTNSTGAAVTLPNGSVWTVLVDHVVLNKVLSFTDDEIAISGSIPVTYSEAMTYGASTTVIEWVWDINIYRTDNSLTITAASGSNAVTGLTPGTTYYFYPYYDEAAQIVAFVAGGEGSDGTAHLGPSLAVTQAQARCDRVPLSAAPMVAATVGTFGSGSSFMIGGSGGGLLA